MGTGTSKVPSEREDGSGPILSESGSDASSSGSHDELRDLLVKNINIKLMLLGLGVIIGGLCIAIVISNRGRISSETGNTLLSTNNAARKRNACVVDLQIASQIESNKVADAVFNRLGVLDGRNPTTGKDIPKTMNAEGKLVADPNLQKVLAAKYFNDGVEARKSRAKIDKMLAQPMLNRICGKPIVEDPSKN